MRGRPSEYDPGVALRFCEAVATSSVGIQRICESAEFPDPKTLYRWMNAHEDFRQQYARAKILQTQILADEITEIADNTQAGEIVTLKGEDREIKMQDMIDHRKLRIEARKWLLSKLVPDKYGDKQQLELSGSLDLAGRLSAARERKVPKK